MATAASVEKTLHELIGRFGSANRDARSGLPERRTLLCVVPDVSAMFHAEYSGGTIRKFRKLAEREPADVTITISSDDLSALVEGRLSVGSALLMRRVRVDASMQDLLLLRALFR